MFRTLGYNYNTIDDKIFIINSEGLRHLCVTNRHNQILGIVTREDLASAHSVKSSNSGSNKSEKVKKGRNQSFSLHHTIDLDLHENELL